MLKQINENHRPVIITQNGKPRAVIQDPQTYENMISALGMLKILAQGEKDIRDDNTIDQDDLFQKIKQKLARKKQRK